MATNHTTNYQLNQWEATDQVLRTDFNADNAKLDAALKANADAISAETAAREALAAQKADLSAAEALSQTVAQKADRTEVDALAAKAGVQLIRRDILNESAGTYYLNLSDVDWDQWAVVTVRLKPVLTAGDEFRFYLHLGSTSPQITDNPVSQAVLIFHPYFDGNARIMGFYFPGGYEGNGLVLDESYAQMESLELGAEDGSFQPGSVFELWGTK